MVILAEELKNLSNDYSAKESLFKQETSCELVTSDLDKDFSKLTEPISVIISAYNEYEDLPITLKSLGKQTYTNFEVVIVDDGSDTPLDDCFTNLNLPYPIKFVRILENKGIRYAKNVATYVATFENIVCIDASVIVDKNHLATMGLRLQYSKNCLFVGFRERINPDGYEVKIKTPPDITADWRYAMKFREDFPCSNLKQELIPFDGMVNVVTQTNNFKDFGFGRVVANLDLPLMVIGCNIAYKRSNAIQSGGWPELASDYGLDDFGFGLNMIAKGLTVVPVLNSICYVLSEPKETLSLIRKNRPKYLEYATKESSWSFPKREVRLLKEKNNISYYTIDE